MSLRRLATLVVSGLAWLGCTTHVAPKLPPRLFSIGSPTIDVHVYVSDAFSDNEHCNLINGVTLWERATSGMVSWHVFPISGDDLPSESPKRNDDGTQTLVVVFRRALSTDQWVVDYDAKQNDGTHLLGMLFGHSGYANDYTIAAIVADRQSSDRMETWTMSHEFGHALGLHHIEDMGSIMSAYYNFNVKAPTKHDLTEFCKVWGCDVHNITQ